MLALMMIGHSSFGKIIEAVERAEQSRAPVQRLADRLAGYLVYFALGAAALTFILTHDIRSEVIDTIRAHGRTVRLVGFDAPESGLRAQCEGERTLAAKATIRLRQLVSGGGLDSELAAVRASALAKDAASAA